MTQNTDIIRQVAHKYAETHMWWEWQIPVYLFLGGIVAGLMVLTSYRIVKGPDEERSLQFRLISWLVPVLLSLGMLALFLDLSNRLNVMRFYAAFIPTAPMSWGAWILIAVYPISILFALAELPKGILESLKKNKIGTLVAGLSDWANDPVRKSRIAWFNLALGVGIGIYTGVLLGNLAARPLWNSAILGPLFLASGLSTGAAFMLLFGLSKKERHLIGRADIVFITLELVLLSLFIITLLNGSTVQQEAVSLLMNNTYAVWFWSLVIIAGLLFPLAVEVVGYKRGRESRWVAPVMVLVGGFALRWILVFAGQTVSW